jgi:hypothetical protein
VVALLDCQDLVDGEVSVFEGKRARCELEQPRVRSGHGDEFKFPCRAGTFALSPLCRLTRRNRPG